MLGDGDLQKAGVEGGKERYINRSRYAARMVQLFTIPRVRRATLAAFVVMAAQQMCGSASPFLVWLCRNRLIGL